MKTTPKPGASRAPPHFSYSPAQIGDAAGLGPGSVGMAVQATLLLGLLLVVLCPGDAALLEANGNLNCRCAKTTTAFIPLRKYESVEVRPVGSSCRRLEVLIKLKSLERICVDPNTLWVRKLLQDLPKLRKKAAPQ
ncbi:C-X-C motif chemokine 13-like [Lagopus muta]|uniref:C-X-C motif chemokine 13-like n=1 Tax=Lagopus muta TaxID=64668 RepID=UPI0020A20A66|nr:C-X-C motif chemokine 13-like [Lagopus muta]